MAATMAAQPPADVFSSQAQIMPEEIVCICFVFLSILIDFFVKQGDGPNENFI